MDARIRAHRILRKIGRVKWVGDDREMKAENLNGLGEKICLYDQIKESGSSIDFYERGFRIELGGKAQVFSYQEISSVRALGEDKRSASLMFSSFDGREVGFRPFSDGKINDAWELLRFFNRVGEDLKKE